MRNLATAKPVQAKDTANESFAKLWEYSLKKATTGRPLTTSPRRSDWRNEPFTGISAAKRTWWKAQHGVESKFKKVYKKYQNFLSSLILQGKKEKVFKKEMDEDLAALVIIAFHDGILIRWFMNQSEIDGEAYVNTFKKIMLNGLVA